MSKLVRACAVVVAVATSLAGGIAAAQIQSGVARKAAPPAVALGVPVPVANANAKANASQRLSTNATAASGSSLNFASGQPALRYLPDDLPTAKDPVRREAVKDGAKEASVSTRGAAAPGSTSEFAPAPGVLRANMPPVTFADAQRVLKARVLPPNVNQGVTAAPKTSKTSASASTSTSTLASAMKISGDANALGLASIAELARSLRHHPDLIYQYVRNSIEYYPTHGLQKGPLGAVLDSLAYDPEGRLRQTVIGASTTNLLYDATDLVAEYDAAGTTLQRRYVHGPGTDEPIVWYEGAGTTAKNWLYADHLGSIVATANATGTSTGIYSYGPYGEPNTTTGPRFRYTGQQLIGELGLYYYKARFYSPSLGRFLQTDPIGYKDDVNLYAYVGNNPANRTDPSGLLAHEAAALSAGVGGAQTYAVRNPAVQGSSLGPWFDDRPLPPEPGLQGVYPEQLLIGGGLGMLRGAGQALVTGASAAAVKEAGALAANAAHGARLAEQLTMQSARRHLRRLER